MVYIAPYSEHMHERPTDESLEQGRNRSGLLGEWHALCISPDWLDALGLMRCVMCDASELAERAHMLACARHACDYSSVRGE